MARIAHLTDSEASGQTADLFGAIKSVGTVEDLVARMEREYHEAKVRMLANSNYTPWQALAEAAE